MSWALAAVVVGNQTFRNQGQALAAVVVGNQIFRSQGQALAVVAAEAAEAVDLVAY